MSVLYVAELGSMHEGNPALACRMIHEAKQAGADICKLQFGWPDTDKLRHIDMAFAEKVAAYCESVGVELMASIWSAEGLELARHVGMKRYKIAHQKSGDTELVRAVLQDARVTFISYETSTPQYIYPHALFLYCPPTYPTYPKELRMPAVMGEAHGWFGYSDHTIGNGACLLAVARGAQYIEKHLTTNPASQTVRDNAFSATPAQFAELVRAGREIEMVRNAPAL